MLCISMLPLSYRYSIDTGKRPLGHMLKWLQYIDIDN